MMLSAPVCWQIRIIACRWRDGVVMSMSEGSMTVVIPMKAAAFKLKARLASYYGAQVLNVRALTMCRYVTFRG